MSELNNKIGATESEVGMKCKECGKSIKNCDTFTLETKDGDVKYHLECAEKTGIYIRNMGYNVSYDYPMRHATGETVTDMKDALRIKAERIKEGFINVRINPVVY